MDAELNEFENINDQFKTAKSFIEKMKILFNDLFKRKL